MKRLNTTRDAPYVAFDFDSTLSVHEHGESEFGEPIPEMMAIIKRLVKPGRKLGVKIFTARVGPHPLDPSFDPARAAKRIQDWLEQHGLPRLEITCTKCYNMVALFDDRAFNVVKNKRLRRPKINAITRSSPLSWEDHRKIYVSLCEEIMKTLSLSEIRKLESNGYISSAFEQAGGHYLNRGFGLSYDYSKESMEDLKKRAECNTRIALHR